MSTTIELPITGMTCASCANRIERKLNKLDGVHASVNYATEKATVDYDPAAVEPEALVGAVEAAGYHAELPADRAERDRNVDETAPLRFRLILSAVLSLPVLLVSMIPALQFDNWQWLALNAATPVVLWGAWPFHQAAWANLRHGTATMDTLISLGTLSAWLWSLYALVFGDAGMAGMRMSFDLIPQQGEGADHIYLETAAVVTTFILAGRYFEARAKRRAGAALKALLELGAKEVTLLDGRTDRRRAAEGRRPLHRPPGREGRHRRRRRGGPLGGRHEPADGRVGAGRGPARRRGRGRDGQRRRAAGRPRDEGRRRHRAGADRRGSSPPPRPARRRSSGSPTASPASSSRS